MDSKCDFPVTDWKHVIADVKSMFNVVVVFRILVWYHGDYHEYLRLSNDNYINHFNTSDNNFHVTKTLFRAKRCSRFIRVLHFTLWLEFISHSFRYVCFFFVVSHTLDVNDDTIQNLKPKISIKLRERVCDYDITDVTSYFFSSDYYESSFSILH